jgi:hypothetical protein
MLGVAVGVGVGLIVNVGVGDAVGVTNCAHAGAANNKNIIVNSDFI